MGSLPEREQEGSAKEFLKAGECKDLSGENIDLETWSKVPVHSHKKGFVYKMKIFRITWIGTWTIKLYNLKDMQISNRLTTNVFGTHQRGSLWNETAGGWKELKNYVLFLCNVSILIVPLGNRLKNGKPVFCMDGRIIL